MVWYDREIDRRVNWINRCYPEGFDDAGQLFRAWSANFDYHLELRARGKSSIEELFWLTQGFIRIGKEQFGERNDYVRWLEEKIEEAPILKGIRDSVMTRSALKKAILKSPRSRWKKEEKVLPLPPEMPKFGEVVYPTDSVLRFSCSRVPTELEDVCIEGDHVICNGPIVDLERHEVIRRTVLPYDPEVTYVDDKGNTRDLGCEREITRTTNYRLIAMDGPGTSYPLIFEQSQKGEVSQGIDIKKTMRLVDRATR